MTISNFASFLLTVVFFSLSASMNAQGCKCTVEVVNNETVFSPACAIPQDICALEVGDNVNQVDLARFTDLRGIHIKLGNNVQPTFLGSALSDSKTMFIAQGGVNMTVLGDLPGQERTMQSGAGNNPNGIKAYNKEISQCAGDCTLLAPTATASTARTAFASMSLPVTIISWEAESTRQGIELTWETGQETDNDYFEVYHSTDGIAFELLTQVAGNGSTDRISTYRAYDAEAGAGVHYYRLEQVDFDGTRSVLGLRQAEVAGRAAEVAASLSPNPVSAGGELTVHLSDAAGTAVRIVDLAGRLVAQSALSAGGSFQVPSDLRAGMYVVIARDQAIRLVVRP